MTPAVKRQIKRWHRISIVIPVAVLLVAVVNGWINVWIALLILAALVPGWYAIWRFALNAPTLVEGKRSASGRDVSFLTPYAQTIIDILPDALVLVGSTREVIEANRAARELFGVRLMGRDFTQILRHPDAVAAMDRVLERRQQEQREITILSPGERHFVMTALPLTGEIAVDDSVVRDSGVGMAVALHEVTAVRRSERMRADFVANASHELRTPLASLIGFIETLQSMGGDDPDAQRRFLGIMEQESSRMARLIDDLLSLSRIELDEHVSPSGVVDLAAIINSVVEVQRMRADERKIKVNVSRETDDPMVVGDSDQLTQVLQNLVDNAIKYGRRGGEVRIHVRPIDRIPETGDRAIAIEIFNEGEGISREHLPRLTDRFYRVDAARSRDLGGTGLGLAIVKHIVNRHRGRLAFDSALGVGTTVTVFLPAASSETA